MSLNVRLPQINAQKFSKGLVLRAALRGAQSEVWPFLDKLGEQRISKLIDENRSLVAMLKPEQMPAKWQQYIEQAPQYKWALSLLSEQEMVQLFPPWFVRLVSRDEASVKWFAHEIELIKALFGR